MTGLKLILPAIVLNLTSDLMICFKLQLYSNFLSRNIFLDSLKSNKTLAEVVQVLHVQCFVLRHANVRKENCNEIIPIIQQPLPSSLIPLGQELLTLMLSQQFGKICLFSLTPLTNTLMMKVMLQKIPINRLLIFLSLIRYVHNY